MLETIYDWIGRVELGHNPFGWYLVPRFFKHGSVFYGDGNYADEYGLFWFSTRVSLYGNVMTYKQHLDSQSTNKED